MTPDRAGEPQLEDPSPQSGHTEPANRLAFSPDGSTLASLGEALDGSSGVILWRTAGPAPR
jgi:hypothetical protein